jgi:hypothetical protein
MPREPFGGSEIGYDVDHGKLFLDTSIEEVKCATVPDADDEVAWHLNFE